METIRLKQFCLIVETGSMAKASELLYISHSALSKSMRLLQDEIGMVLLRPAGRGITATDQGLEFYHRAKAFLEHEHRLLQFDDVSRSSVLRVGAVEVFLACLAEGLTRDFLEAHAVSMVEMDPGNLEQAIIQRQLDYGFTYLPIPMENLDVIEIGRFRMGCYYLKGAFDNADISNIPFVVPPQTFTNNPFGIKERDGWLESIYTRHKKYYVNLLSTAIDFTLKGVCAVYMPDFVARKVNKTRKVNDRLVEYPLPKKHQIFHRAFLLKHKDHGEKSIESHLFKTVKKIL